MKRKNNPRNKENWTNWNSNKKKLNWNDKAAHTLKNKHNEKCVDFCNFVFQTLWIFSKKSRNQMKMIASIGLDRLVILCKLSNL